MEPYLGQIQPFGFNFAPKGWMQCNGQLLSIAANTALFSLLGTIYGGDGRTTFALPDLRGRAPMSYGSGPGLSTRFIGERSGSETNTITTLQMPAHVHGLTNGNARVIVNATNNGDVINETDGGANVLGTSGLMPDIYRSSPSGSDHLGGVSISGATDSMGMGTPVNNMQPYLAINYCIATVGIFPSRN